MGPRLGLSPGEVGDLREGRLVEVADHTGIDALLVGRFPDGRLSRVAVRETAAAVRDAVHALRPQVVIGPDPRGVNGHADHIAAHFAIRHALAGRPEIRFAMMAYTEETVEAAKPRLLFPTPDAEIDVALRLSDAEAAAKEACLRAHEALITLREDGDPDLIRREPVEHFDLLGEEFDPPLDDLFRRM